MKLTNATEQAIAIIAILATQDEHIPASSKAIYEKLSISQSYAKKLLRKLVVSKIIEGVSGNNGGFYIEKKLSEISLLNIVESIEGPFHSFPHIGVLERAFSDFSKIAHNGDKVIASYFDLADINWTEKLRHISVQNILSNVFSDYENIPKRNWNNYNGDEK